jgi:hypothetical protein
VEGKGGCHMQDEIVIGDSKLRAYNNIYGNFFSA